MKSFYKISYILFFSLTIIIGCEVEEVQDPNNPSLAGVLNNASKAELQVLVTGLEARNRDYFTNATQLFGTFGREVFPYFGSDPRFQNEWLGLAITETYPDFFASAGSYNGPYGAIKQSNVLISAAEASAAITSEEANGYYGFAKTLKGFQLIFPLMQQYENGIRTDVDDPLNPGPIKGYSEALSDIRSILDEGFSDLQSAGSSFSFSLSSGFSGFDTPASMAQLNRAIAARVSLYQEDYDAALTALNNSFFDIDGSFYIGPAHVYGEAPDVNNPLFYPYDRSTNTILIVHPAMIEDTLANDGRFERKFVERVENPVTNSNIVSGETQIVGRFQDNRWSSNVAPIQFIRNEELILIFAEAQLMNGIPTQAVAAIDVIRTGWGVAPYAGGTSEAELLDEILFQRRYSLWAEGGHRWIDLRRTNRLTEAYVDLRDGGNIFTQVSRRTSETNWDNEN